MKILLTGASGLVGSAVARIGARQGHTLIGVTGRYTGPLAGLGFGVKDLFHIHGYPTSGGQPLLLALLGVQNRTEAVYVAARLGLHAGHLPDA